MRAGVSPAIFAVVLLQVTAGLAACPDGRSKNCVNLNLVPQRWDQVVTDQPTAVPKAVPARDSKPPYTGPTLGLSPTVHKTPTVGYRWAID